MEKAKLNVEKGDGRDKRRYRRIDVDVPIKYKIINRKIVKELVDPKQFFDEGKSVNLSVGGISLVTRLALTKRDYIKLEISLPRAQRTNRALEEAMRGTPNPQAGGQGYLA